MKTICPNHNDSTPSLHHYSDGAYCFVCGYSTKTQYPKNIGQIKSTSEFKKELEYIDSLPKKTIRGLDFRTDDEGFYVLWPDRSYYKKRLFSGPVRYLAPKGVRQSLFIYADGAKDILAVVEGEINAMSLEKSIARPGLDIASPGSANNLGKFLPAYLQYNKIYVIVDNDAAGLAYGLDLKFKLLKQQKNTELVAVDKDYNDVLMESGNYGVKKAFQKETGLDLF